MGGQVSHNPYSAHARSTASGAASDRVSAVGVDPWRAIVQHRPTVRVRHRSQRVHARPILEFFIAFAIA